MGSKGLAVHTHSHKPRPQTPKHTFLTSISYLDSKQAPQTTYPKLALIFPTSYVSLPSPTPLCRGHSPGSVPVLLSLQQLTSWNHSSLCVLAQSFNSIYHVPILTRSGPRVLPHQLEPTACSSLGLLTHVPGMSLAFVSVPSYHP